MTTVVKLSNKELLLSAYELMGDSLRSLAN
jgi:hypothetical protein